MIRWNFICCPWIFQIWICEAMPKLGEMIGQRIPGNHIPRWIGWNINVKVQNITVARISKVIEEDDEFFVRPTLVPSAEEKAQLFYERLHSYVDNADDIIDKISSFLGGNVILRNNPRIVAGEEAHNNTVNPLIATSNAIKKYLNVFSESSSMWVTVPGFTCFKI
ncbi:uncharacterized protein LOC133814060 [Humulus lupulus]|uniref:uncharacterized protein LOC133814060 n=1 Tax=Humulus lupulus TaxID=3486 RepID=UPI002B40A0DA|nr:uncharacterized protein LOC133814060 [Humulus lupulus]